MARSFDHPSLLKDEEIQTHLEDCPDCRREEFYYKQLSNVHDLVFPYEVSPNFNYKLQVRLANSPQLAPLEIASGKWRLRWYHSAGIAGAVAVLALLLAPMVYRTPLPPENLASVEPGTPTPAVLERTIPIPLFEGIAQASELPAFHLKPESPIAAQFASASSEPVRPGVDGESTEGWEESWVWMGDSDNGYFVPVRRYQQSSVSSEPVLLLPAASTNQSVNIVY